MSTIGTYFSINFPVKGAVPRVGSAQGKIN